MSDSNIDHASVLFGSSTPSAKPATSNAPAQDNTVADRLFGSTTPRAPQQREQPTPAQQREQQRRQREPADEQQQQPEGDAVNDKNAKKLYGDSNIHGDAERALATALIEDQLVTREVAETAAASYSEMFTRHQLNASESKQLVDVGVSVARNPPDQATVASWTQQSREALVSEFGSDGVGLALQDAKALVNSDPKLKKFLHDTGLGNHPQVVRVVAQKARALRKAGKL